MVSERIGDHYKPKKQARSTVMHNVNGSISSYSEFGSDDHSKGVAIFTVMATVMVVAPVLWGIFSHVAG